MSKWIVSGVLCGILSMAIGCGEPKKPIPPDSCSPVPYKVLVENGVRYLRVTLPDGNLVVVNIDTLPMYKKPAPDAAGEPTAAGSGARSSAAAGSGGATNFVEEPCPCEEDPCRPLCYTLRRIQGPGANLCTK